MEVWLHAFSFAGKVAPLARQAEEWGFDGLLVADSQNLNAEVPGSLDADPDLVAQTNAAFARDVLPRL